jgi:GT2 family glycosyltransferase
MKKVYISILNFKSRKNTMDCLRSVNKIRKINFSLNIILIDNASSENFYLDEDFKSEIPIKIIKTDSNLGFSGGNNIGFKYALENGADYICLLNNDTVVDEFFLENLLKIGEENKEFGILVPKIYFAKGFEFYKGYKENELGKVIWYAGGKMDWKNVIGYHSGVDRVDRGQFDKSGETELATGCCMLIKKEVFKNIGNLDDKYFLYYEDSDLSMRAKNAGFKIIYVPDSIIWHKNAGSQGGSGSALQDYYITRNRLLFGFKYAPVRSKLALFKESLFLLLKGRLWQKKGVADYYCRRLGKGSYKI